MAETGLLSLIRKLNEDLRAASENARYEPRNRTTNWIGDSSIGRSEFQRPPAPVVVESRFEFDEEPDRILVTPPPAGTLEMCRQCGRVVGDGLVTWRGEEVCRRCAVETSRTEVPLVSSHQKLEPLVHECPICLEERGDEFVTFRGYGMCRECAASLGDGEYLDSPSERRSADRTGEVQQATLTESTESPDPENGPVPDGSPGLLNVPVASPQPEERISVPPPEIGAEVTRWDVPTLFGLENEGLNWITPVVIARSVAFLFVDLQAKRSSNSYYRSRNRFVSDTLLQWHRPQQLAGDFAETQVLAEHKESGRLVFLFARPKRMVAGKSRKYNYLGEIEFISLREEGALFMWQLTEPVPRRLWADLEVMDG